MFGTMVHRSALAGLAIVLLSASVTSALEVFTITAAFQNDDFALAEFAARLESCAVENFSLLNNNLKADCVSRLISQSATCSSTPSGAFVCVIDGVTVDTADITFECDGDCPSADTNIKQAMDAAANCGDGTKTTVAGFTGECYTSAYCLVQGAAAAEQAVTSFGDFCPSRTGEYCCETGITRDDNTFPVSDMLIPDGDTFRRIDHTANMDFKIFYDVAAPAQLQLKVEVPYVEPESNLTYTENGALITIPMCPTSYLIDFTPPVETYPQASESPVRIADDWLPLTHFPHPDLVGRPRSTCGNYDMDYNNATSFVDGFKFPTVENSFTYGAVPGVEPGVWGDASGSTTGIPHGSVTFWHKGEPVGAAGQKRLNYTVGNGEFGHFDLVKAWTKCKNLNDDAQLVRKRENADETFINGVAYPVETYEWTLSVCAVGYFGLNCRTRTDTQMYSKTCRKIPASFSITPQQIAHVSVSPVTEQLVSKTFLQTVDAFTDDCPELHERIAVTLNLVMFGTDYEIVTSEVHDLLSPSSVFANASATKNFAVSESTEQTTFADYLAAQEALELPIGEGVVVLKQNDVTSGTVSVYYRKVVIVTQCYKTEWNSAEGTRANPDVFADAIAGSDPNVLIDLELIVEKDVVDISGGNADEPLPGESKIKNTLNLRILATKETFSLPTESKLQQKDVTAYHRLYGKYETAKLDNGVNLPNGLPANAILDGGVQLCSKHQLIEYDAQTANLLPNAVGACMLKTGLDPKWDALKGTTIKYRTTGMAEPADYTYGCFPDWIDARDMTPVDGVYVFSGPVPRVSDALESMFWFVQKQELETTQLLANEFMTDRFATALFWYNTSDGGYVVTKSSRFEHEPVDFNSNPAGCVTSPGAMKSSCNLVCFDLVEGLLTDPQGLVAREVLVHHVSVATIANEADSVAENKFPASRHRRMLLQSVSSTAPSTTPSSDSLATGMATIKVKASPRDADVEVHESYDRDSVSGPKNFQMWFFPVFFVLIFVMVIILGCVCAQQRYKQKSRGGNREPLMNGNKMFD